MERKWIKLSENKFSFTVGNKIAGEMQISNSTTANKATCKIGEEVFIIQRTGFWKTAVEIFDIKGKLVAKTSTEKWYANSSLLEYGDKKYKLILQNNPLAEYAIIDGDRTILSYGLNTDHDKIAVRIIVDKYDSNLLFDFLLWYLFVPIVAESTGDDLTFLLLVTA